MVAFFGLMISKLKWDRPFIMRFIFDYGLSFVVVILSLSQVSEWGDINTAECCSQALLHHIR